MDRSQGPSNKHVVFLFMGFLVLFILVFALGVIVGKGLSDSRVAVSQNIQEEKNDGMEDDIAIQDSYEPVSSDNKEEDELQGILDEVKSKELETTGEVSTTETASVDSYELLQENEEQEERNIKLPSDANINLKVEKPEYVEKEVSKPKVSSSAPLPAIDPNGKYTIQIGSFKNESDAKKLQNKLKSGGYPAFIKQANIGEETWFRLRVGTFTNKDQAKIYGDMLLRKEPGMVQSVYVTPNL